MAESFRDHFAHIVDLARRKLHEIHSSQEIDAERAILSIEGERFPYRIVLKETISAKGRRYAYYILQGERVILAWISPDARHCVSNWRCVRRAFD